MGVALYIIKLREGEDGVKQNLTVDEQNTLLLHRPN